MSIFTASTKFHLLGVDPAKRHTHDFYPRGITFVPLEEKEGKVTFPMNGTSVESILCGVKISQSVLNWLETKPGICQDYPSNLTAEIEDLDSRFGAALFERERTDGGNPCTKIFGDFRRSC